MEKVNYYVFESITRERKCQKTKEKIKTTQTERVSKEATTAELYSKMAKTKHQYLTQNL